MELCDSSRGTEFLKLLIFICLKYSKELPQILTEVGQKDPKLCPRKKKEHPKLANKSLDTIITKMRVNYLLDDYTKQCQ